MPRSIHKQIIVYAFLLISTLGVTVHLSSAQSVESPPVDLVVLIDNSCSMFAPEQTQGANCGTPIGNDPDFLQIIGSDLFFASLGFAESNQSEYQVGVVSFGGTPTLISPLGPLHPQRGSLARAIENPLPQYYTDITAALQLGYQELRQSPNRKPANLPAILLITDGIPDPRIGQTNEDIENLISANSDISLFIMLLQNASEAEDTEYAEYINFWQ